jgi:bacillithiol biosynthesis deacetylase BshB1
MDAVFFGAHPDDVELVSGGLAARLAAHGHAVAIVDLTRGELGSRGTREERAGEADAAARELGVAARENLTLPDLGLDRSSREQLTAVVECLRRHRPTLVVAPDRDDAHPDHVEAAALIDRACYAAGLARLDARGERHRPVRVLHALYRSAERPHVIVDISEAWERKMRAVLRYASQLEAGRGPGTYLTAPGFLDEIEARARAWGASIGARFGEAFRARGPFAIHDARALLATPSGGAA